MQVDSISSITKIKKFCDKFFCDQNPFISFDFFSKLEKSDCTNQDTDWVPEHLIFRKRDKLIGFIPNFKKFNSNGEYIFDHIFANAYHHYGIDYYPKYLSAIPFTPVTKSKIIYSEKELKVEDISEPLINFLITKKIPSFHINFIEKEKSDLLKQNLFFQRTGIQYFWNNKNYKNFEQFLNELKRKKRKNITKERDYLKINKVSFKIKEGKDINENDIELFFKCYKNTIEKKWSYAYLNLKFFYEVLNSSIKKNIILIQAYKDEIFLGCAMHLKGRDTLYGRYWGAVHEVPYLHFELCYYQAIEYAIKNNFQKIEAGAQGEHKISRGYLPTLTYSNHWFSNESLQKPISNFLAEEQTKIKETLNYLRTYSPFKV